MVDQPRTPSVGSERFAALFEPDPEKLTQDSAAEQLGVTQQSVSDWKNGNKRPDYENRKRLLDRFGIAMDDWDRPAAQAQRARRKQKRSRATSASR